MKILYAASEALPFIASGGLADVAGSLPKALRNRQHACRVVIPYYSGIKQELKENLKFITYFNVPLAWRNQYCGVFEANVNGVIYYLLDNEYYFNRSGIYGFYDDAERFAFFSKAVVEMLEYIDFEPEIIHVNDWQTALVPVYLDYFYRNIEKYKNIKTVFTIHNIQYQGKYGLEILGDVLGLPPYAQASLEFDGCLNFMKGAIEHADVISTVSPTYAQEIMDPWYSHGLDSILHAKRYKLKGILNGIDTSIYDPSSDQNLCEDFTPEDLTGKAADKAELQRLMDMEENPDTMLIGMVTRLVSHKGLDLVKYIFNEIINKGMSVALLGNGDYAYEEFFQEMKDRYPGRVGVKIGFIPELARKIYAGSDVFLMPSKSEPCGLAQMVALRYGTIPVVRETGGLKDSIIDLGAPEGKGNGFTFKTYNAHDMLGALERAQKLYANKDEWNQAVKNAMQCDFSWKRSAAEYVEMYKSIL